MNRPRYQLGTLYSEPRKSGPDVWVYRWRETDEQGRRTLRKQIVGTVRELRTQADAQRAAETLRLSVNRYTIDHGGSVVTVHKLVEHYRMKEMPMDTHEGKTRATKLVYQNCLKLYIVPRWGDYPLRRVTSVEVEDWLKTLKLAASTRTKIRNLMSTIFRHAIRWGFLGQQENPIALVRVKAGRKRVPDTLTGEEFRALMAVLPDRERVMGGICATTGLRVCEVLGLKWEDIDFVRKTANVLRSYVSGSIGPCKTEVSQQPVPLDAITLQRLIAWRGLCAFGADTDWIFASERLFGKLPVWPDILRSRILQPAAKRAGITKHIGWHTFRHTYSSLLAATGSDVKVVQELMRHAKVSTTMEVYTHAGMDKKRVAQSKAVDVLFNRTPQQT
ncbi:site-specific integrase [Granulicella sp. dw_53]|uniref:tyrosine-type recombinase/integrase n=1 Tax=Granulicella sp. dw_53 TaxID=2719792 RepID=UPI001BD3FE91|nr:site-specific integrase [Granulicella sp. dw_53]